MMIISNFLEPSELLLDHPGLKLSLMLKMLYFFIELDWTNDLQHFQKMLFPRSKEEEGRNYEET
jgi:hypothetical protein